MGDERAKRVADLFTAKEGNQIQLSMVDELDATQQAKDVDAERALVVFGILNLARVADNS